jgi:type IV pilus assembly protein PilA
MVAMVRTRALRRGFTLIELMIVVVIVAVLATLAVVGYRKMILASHVSEATGMVQSIRVAQEEYFSETRQYANISTSLTTYYPQGNPSYTVGVTAWGAACGGACTANMDWSMLPVHVDGPVMFGYATVAGPPGQAPAPASVTVNGKTVTFPSSPQTDWFIVAATCDLDGNGTPNTSVYTTSWQNSVLIDHEGQ